MLPAVLFPLIRVFQVLDERPGAAAQDPPATAQAEAAGGLPSAADWQPHAAAGSPWWAWVVAGLLLAAILYLLWQACAKRKLYRVRHAVPPGRREDLQAAVRRAEEKTVGEVVPVVLERSDRYPAADLWCGLLFGLAGYVIAWALPLGWTPLEFLITILVSGAAGWGASRLLPELRRNFIAPWRAVEQAEEQAFQEFFRLGLHETAGRTGVLLFVSLLERRVVVLGDKGIDERLEPAAWNELRQGLLDFARRGRLADGLEAAIAQVGEILAGEFPRKEGDRNELPDRVVVRRQ